MTTKRFRYRWRIITVIAALIMVMISTSGGAWAQSTQSCNVTYTIANQWNTGFQVSVDIKNTGTTTINGWTLRWAFANGQTISQVWKATYTQTGANVSATNLSWNGTIAPNATEYVGVIGNWSGANNKPTAFTLNSTACTVTP